LSPSFDTVGWFARNGTLLQRVGRVLLGGAEAPLPRRMIVATDALELVPAPARQTFTAMIDSLARGFPVVEQGRIASDDVPLSEYLVHLGHIQGCEARRVLGPWLSENEPRYGSGAFDTIHGAPDELSSDASSFREAVTRRLRALLGPGVVLCFPTAAGPAPRSGDSDQGLHRRWTDLVLCSAAGLAGLPQATFPVGLVDGLPVGASVLGGPGADEFLLELGARVPVRLP
jgi:amidase